MRLIIALWVAMGFGGAVFADEADHVANPDTVQITLGQLANDPEEAGQKFVPATVSSDVAVAIVLRGIVTEDGEDFTVFKARSLFGKKVWSKTDFIQINPGKTLKLVPPNYKLIAPPKFVSGTSRGMMFDFGPKGEVWAVYE